MSVIGDIRVSLDAMGFEQQAFLFAFLTSYPLTLGGMLEARARRWAGMVATAAMLGFVVATDPWFHGILLGAFIVVAMGLFIAAVCTLDRLPRLVLRPPLVPVRLPAETPLAVSEAPRERDGARPHALPLTGRAGTT